MNTDWYRKNFKKITEELNGIIEKAEVNNYNNTVPVKKDREKIREIIFDFIKKNKRIVYGGTAINYWLCKKDKEKTKWAKILQELEENADDHARQGLSPEEEKGYKNYKSLIENLRRIHIGEVDHYGKE